MVRRILSSILFTAALCAAVPATYACETGSQEAKGDKHVNRQDSKEVAAKKQEDSAARAQLKVEESSRTRSVGRHGNAQMTRERVLRE